MKKGYLETFWNVVHLEEEEKEDLEMVATEYRTGLENMERNDSKK